MNDFFSAHIFRCGNYFLFNLAAYHPFVFYRGLDRDGQVNFVVRARNLFPQMRSLFISCCQFLLESLNANGSIYWAIGSGCDEIVHWSDDWRIVDGTREIHTPKRFSVAVTQPTREFANRKAWTHRINTVCQWMEEKLNKDDMRSSRKTEAIWIFTDDCPGMQQSDKLW